MWKNLFNSLRHGPWGVSMFALTSVMVLSWWSMAAAKPQAWVVQPLTLTSMCSSDPAVYRVWRVHNAAPTSVAFTWDVYGTSQTGQGVAPANGDTFFNTDTVPDSPNTTRLFLNGVLVTTKASSAEACPTETPTPTMTATETETPPPTATPTATATATETPLPTATPTAMATATETPLPSATPTATATDMQPPTPTVTAYATATPWPTRTNVPSASRMSIMPAQQAVQVGDNFSFTVQTNADRPVRAAQAGLVFDPNIVQCVNVQRGSFFKDWGDSHNTAILYYPVAVIDNTAGTISDAGFAYLLPANYPTPAGDYEHLSGPSGLGTLFIINCTAKASGTSALTLMNVKMYDDARSSQLTGRLQVSVDNGQVIVVVTPTATEAQPPTPTATATQPPTSTGTPTVGAWMAFETPAAPVSVGQVVDVKVMVDVGSGTSRAAQFSMTWDKSVLRCEGVEEGSFYSAWAAAHPPAITLAVPALSCNDIDATGPYTTGVGIAIFSSQAEVIGQGPSGRGDLAVIHFTTLAAGASPLAFSNALVTNAGSMVSGTYRLQNYRTASEDAQVVVAAPTATATPTAWPTTAPTPTSTPSVVPLVTVSAPTLSGGVGEPVTVAVTLNTNVPSRAARFRLQFNPALLRCEAVNEGDFYRTWALAHGGSTLLLPQPACDNVAGTTSDIGVAVMGGDRGWGPNGTGVLATVRFTALAAGASPLTLTNVNVLDAGFPNLLSLPFIVSPGQVTVAPARPLWDVNGDHVVDIADVSEIGIHYGESGPPGWIPADVNRDGLIDIGDVSVVGLHWGETW